MMMEEQGVIYSSGKAKIIYYFLFLELFFLFLLLPGENFYQVLSFDSKKPLFCEAPIPHFLPSDYPVFIGGGPPPVLTAEAVVVIDIESGVVLYSMGGNSRLKPASTTKIITALVALDSYSLDEVLLVKRLPGGGAMMGLAIGDKVSVENLLYGLLVASGNDAALALADNYEGGYRGFVAKMNEKAKELHMDDSNFVNPMGFEGAGHYSTALDLARVASFALSNRIIKKIVAIPEITVSDSSYSKWYRLENINELLGESSGVSGIKTGWTEEAGECLVAAAQRNGRKILTVVLGSEDRFSETEALLNWAYSTYKWVSFGREQP